MRFTCRAVAALRLRRMFRDFVSTLLGCSLQPHRSLHLHQFLGLTGCRPGSHSAARIGWRLLLDVGVFPPACRWLAPGCALLNIPLHQRTTRATSSPLPGLTTREPPHAVA